MILGHDRLIAELKKLADKNDLSHGYVFWGPERVGKRTVALALANYLERKKFSESPEILNDCLVIEPGTDKSIGIDKIRQINGFLWQRPNVSNYRLVIVNDCHLLTGQAEDALLKVTENPPPSGFIILIIKNHESLKPTLSSRFQKIYFSPVPKEAISEWLVKEKKCSRGEAEKLSEASFNQPGRALAILYDKNFQELDGMARKFIKLHGRERSNFIKEMVAEDDFNLEDFLDALIAVLSPKDFKTWHRVVELRSRAGYFNLNPRLQLESILSV